MSETTIKIGNYEMIVKITDENINDMLEIKTKSYKSLDVNISKMFQNNYTFCEFCKYRNYCILYFYLNSFKNNKTETVEMLKQTIQDIDDKFNLFFKDGNTNFLEFWNSINCDYGEYFLYLKSYFRLYDNGRGYDMNRFI